MASNEIVSVEAENKVISDLILAFFINPERFKRELLAWDEENKPREIRPNCIDAEIINGSDTKRLE